MLNIYTIKKAISRLKSIINPHMKIQENITPPEEAIN